MFIFVETIVKVFKLPFVGVRRNTSPKIMIFLIIGPTLIRRCANLNKYVVYFIHIVTTLVTVILCKKCSFNINHSKA